MTWPAAKARHELACCRADVLLLVPVSDSGANECSARTKKKGAASSSSGGPPSSEEGAARGWSREVRGDGALMLTPLLLRVRPPACLARGLGGVGVAVADL